MNEAETGLTHQVGIKYRYSAKLITAAAVEAAAILLSLIARSNNYMMIMLFEN